MVEPFAYGVLNTVLPRHVAFVKSSTSSLQRVVNGPRRPSLAANFFIPTSRSDKGKEKAMDLPSVEGLLGCQSWATPPFKKEIWAQDGAMRSVLLGELDDATSSTRALRRTPRTSQASRKRIHRSLSNSLFQNRNSALYSTKSSNKTNQELYVPFVPTIFVKTPPDVPQAPYEEFLSHLKYKAHTRGNIQVLHDTFVQARDAEAFKQLSADDAFKVLNLFGEHIDTICLHSVTPEALGKLALDFQHLYTALPDHVVRELKASGKWEYVVCRLRSFSGNFAHGTTTIKKLAKEKLAKEKLAKEKSAQEKLVEEKLASFDFRTLYDTHLLALSRYKSLGVALEFWSEPGMTHFRNQTPKFAKLTSVDPGLGAAVEKAIHWPRGRRELVSQYLLKMAVLNRSSTAALTVIEGMRRMDVEPYFEHVLNICKLLAAEGNLSRAKDLFNTVRPNDNQFYSQTKLYIYARSGDPAAAMKLLEERKAAGQFQIEDRSNVLLALSLAGRYGEMKDFFEASYPTSKDGFRSPKPPLAQYSICLLAHARAGHVEKVQWWFTDMDKQGVKPNVQIFTHLLTLFKKIGDDRSMMYTYNQMLQSNIRPDRPLYTLMLSHFATRSNNDAADALYLEAIKQGVVPDERMTSALMNAHIQSGSWKEAYRIFTHLSSKLGSHKPLLSVYNTMFKAHLLLGAPFRVMTRLFLLIKKVGFQPDAFSYAILMMSACEAGQLTVAMEILQEIKEEQIEQGRTDLLNTQIMTILMSAYLRNNDRASAKRILDEMVSLGIQPTEITYASIVKAYGTSRVKADMEQAKTFVRKLLESSRETGHLTRSKSIKQPIVNLFLPLMNIPSQNGDVEEVERLYEEFLQGGGRPTIAVYQRLLLAYQRADQIHKALNLWPLIEELAERDNLFAGPSEEVDDENPASGSTSMANIQLPLSVYLDILSKSGMHVEAANTWFKFQKHGFNFDTHNWNHLVVVLIRAGQVERAYEVLERVLLPNERANTINMRISIRSRRLQGVKAAKKHDPLNSYVLVPQGNPLRGSESRIQVAELGSYRKGKLRSQAIDISLIDKDFAYPTRVLEFIRTTWNDWRPHTVIWRTLLIVQLQLEQNFVPKPLEPGGELIQNVAAPDISDRDPEAAQKMINKLKTNYPKTAKRLRRFFRDEQRRLTKEDFERLYSQY